MHRRTKMPPVLAEKSSIDTRDIGHGDEQLAVGPEYVANRLQRCIRATDVLEGMIRMDEIEAPRGEARVLKRAREYFQVFGLTPQPRRPFADLDSENLPSLASHPVQPPAGSTPHIEAYSRLGKNRVFRAEVVTQGFFPSIPPHPHFEFVLVGVVVVRIHPREFSIAVGGIEEDQGTRIASDNWEAAWYPVLPVLGIVEIRKAVGIAQRALG